MNLFKSKRDDEFAELSQQLAQENTNLMVKAAKLQKENHYLRRANRVQPHLRLLLRAEAGAQMIAMWHVAGYRTGRRACLASGLSERTFFAAVALLKVAGVRDSEGNFTTDNALVLERHIREAVACCRSNPDALIARMPKSRRPG